jgi:biopolymer transport protein ExbB
MNGWIDAAAVHLESYLCAGGVVMVPLVIVCLLMWALIIDRLLFFKHLRRKNMAPATAWEHICEGRLPDGKLYGGAVALLAAEFLRRRGSNAEMDDTIMDEALRKFTGRLTDKLAMIGVLAAVAPLLGLLGTVTGMMATFDVLAIFGTGNAKAMANGISEALVTTQTGLLIAIPGLYMKGFLDRRAVGMQQHITAAGYYLRRRLRAAR